MIRSYKIVGLYNDETKKRLDEGEVLSEIRYYGDNGEIVLKDVSATMIFDNSFIVVKSLSTGNLTVIDVKDLIDWTLRPVD